MDIEKLKYVLTKAVMVIAYRAGDVDTEDGSYATTDTDEMIRLEAALCEALGTQYDEIDLAEALKLIDLIHDYKSELEESELSRTELIKQNAALAAENERLETEVEAGKNHYADLFNKRASRVHDLQKAVWLAMDRKSCPGIFMQIVSDAILEHGCGELADTKKSLEIVTAERDSLRDLVKGYQEQEPAYHMNANHNVVTSRMRSKYPNGTAEYYKPLYESPVPAQSPVVAVARAHVRFTDSFPDVELEILDGAFFQTKTVDLFAREALDIVCETCHGDGHYDERLGGEFFSNPKAECPDCEGSGLADKQAHTHDRCPSHEPVDIVSPAMLRAAQLKSELGAIATSKYAGGYDLITEMYEVMYKTSNLHPIHAAYGVQDSGVVDHD